MEQREAYQERVQKELEKSDARIKELRAKADQADSEVRAEYREMLDAVYNIQERARGKFQELENVDEELWEKVRPSMDGVLSELRKAVANIGFHIQ